MPRRKRSRGALRQAEDFRSPYDVDTSWMKFYRCKVCGRRVAANNYQDQKVRARRRKGVAVCSYCSDRAVELYLIVRKLAEGVDPEMLAHEAKEWMHAKTTHQNDPPR